MLEHIEKLRGKSEGEKRRFVFLFSAGVTLVIASFWTVALVFKIANGTLSFDVGAADGRVFANVGEKVNDSWEEFFPKAPSASTTESQNKMEVLLSDPSEEISAEEEDSYPALRVMLGKPEPIEPEPAYPADIY